MELFETELFLKLKLYLHKTELFWKVMYSYGPPHMAKQKQDDQLELTYSSYVRTQDVTLKTCQRRWMIGRSGKRGSGISVLAARHDDDDYFYKNRLGIK